MLTIRRAVCDDIPNIMKFMDEHWKPGNILAKDRDFFEWQFVEDGKVNMFIGIDDEEGKIYGTLGMVIYNKTENPDISGCTWQTIKSSNPLLGVELQDAMWLQMTPRFVFSIGLSKKSVRIDRLLGMVPVVMQHYYRLADQAEYKIAKIEQKIIPAVEDTGYTLEPLHSVDEMKQIISEEKLAGYIMSKDYHYLGKRYFNHPVYHYDIWKIIDDKNRAKSVLITREETAEGSKMCKIIDFYGDSADLGRITAAIDRLMKEKKYEYVDVYSYGVPAEIYEKAGFVYCDEKSRNILPNYFHPFVQENIVLWMVDPQYPGVRMFRGDGDQDRPC